MGGSTIEATGLAKRYLLGERVASYGTLRDALTTMITRRHPDMHEFWALRGIDLDVEEGEALGLVGSNGAGKTTLLRILARITEPTSGSARIRGRVGALLEVGTGFHPELNGRENVFLGGAVMGMTRRDIRSRFDEIVEFAGVEEFLSTPLKRFSTGMRLRLAFAVTAHLEPEVLLVDEVLAVGDLQFQRRCLQRMSRLSHEGRTVVFVSHDIGAVTRLCSRALWLDHGEMKREGPATEVVEAYYTSVASRGGEVELTVEGPAGVASLGVTDAEGRMLARPTRGDPLWLEARVVTDRAIPGLDLALYVVDTQGLRVLDEAWSDQPDKPVLAPGPGRYVVRARFPPFLRATDHVVGVWLGTEHETYVHKEPLALSISPRAEDGQELITRRRVAQPPVEWSSTPAAH